MDRKCGEDVRKQSGKNIVLVLLCLYMISAILPVSALCKSAAASTPTCSGLTYDPAGSKKLDLYIPDTTKFKGPYPVILWIFGGAWMAGNRNDGFPSGLFGLVGPKGIAVASMDYSYSSQAKWPVQSQQCRAVVRWLRANADKYNLDPDFIGAAGMSAGGHLAAFLGTSNGQKTGVSGSVTMDLEGTIGGNTEYSSKVQAVYSMYGVMNFQTMNSVCNGSKSTMDHEGASSPEGALIGGAISQNPDKAKLASPVFFASEDDPPFLLQHGSADQTVPNCQSTELDSALGKVFATNKKEHQIHIINGQGHGFAVTVNADTVVNFFVRHLINSKTSMKNPIAISKELSPAFSFDGKILNVSQSGSFSMSVFDLAGHVISSNKYTADGGRCNIDMRNAGCGLRICRIKTVNGNASQFQIICQ